MLLAPVRRGVSLSDKWTVNDAARMSPNHCGSSLDCSDRNPRALLFTAAVSFGHPCDAKIVNSRLAVVKEIRMDLGEAAMSEKTTGGFCRPPAPILGSEKTDWTMSLDLS